MSHAADHAWLRSAPPALAAELAALDDALVRLEAGGGAWPTAELETVQRDLVRLRVRVRALTETLASGEGA